MPRKASCRSVSADARRMKVAPTKAKRSIAARKVAIHKHREH
jgi:hypothetical protein